MLSVVRVKKMQQEKMRLVFPQNLSGELPRHLIELLPRLGLFKGDDLDRTHLTFQTLEESGRSARADELRDVLHIEREILWDQIIHLGAITGWPSDDGGHQPPLMRGLPERLCLDVGSVEIPLHAALKVVADPMCGRVDPGHEGGMARIRHRRKNWDHPFSTGSLLAQLHEIRHFKPD